MQEEKKWVEVKHPKDLDDLKKQHDEMVAEHGEPKCERIIFDTICPDKEELVALIFQGALQIMRIRKIGSKCNEILIRTSDELNEQLKDIPENEDTWDYIYSMIPPCFMKRTIRIFGSDGSNYLMVITDLDVPEGKKMAEDIVKHLGLKI